VVEKMKRDIDIKKIIGITCLCIVAIWLVALCIYLFIAFPIKGMTLPVIIAAMVTSVLISIGYNWGFKNNGK